MRAFHIPRPQRIITPWPVPPADQAPRVMAVPPPITIDTVPALPKAWLTGSGSPSYKLASHANHGHFTFCRGLPDESGPSLGFKPAKTVTSGADGTRAPSGLQFAFYHDGEDIELHFQNNDRGYLLKIDGEYVSLVPATTPANSFSHIALGSRKLRRFDIITYQAAFAGVRTATSDTVYAAPVRGPRTICIGDSFSIADAYGWTNWFAEGLGWDDVWTSGIGATGFVQDANGVAKSWRDRVQDDVIAYKPEVVFFFGSVNDLSEAPSDVYQAVYDTLSQIRAALPDCIIAGGMNTPFGVEFWQPIGLDVYDAAKRAFTDAGGAWMSVLELPQEFSGTPIGADAELFDNIAQGRAGSAGPPDVVAGQSGFRVNTSSATPNTNLRIGSTVEIGTGSTRERVVITGSAISGGRFVYGFDGAFRFAHFAGERVREVPPCYLTGQGSTVAPSGWGNADVYVGPDGYHPSPEGHRAIGLLNAAMFKRHLREIGRA